MPIAGDRALIFDFGNVLAFFSHAQMCQQIAALSAGKVTAEQVHTAIFGSGRHLLLETGHVEAEQFLLDLQSELCLDSTLDELRTAYTHIFHPNPRVCDLIPRLAARVPIYLASNTDAHHWNHFSQTFATTFSQFTELVKSFEVGFRKPSAEFFAELIRQVGCDASSCIFVDDLSDNITAANVAGLQGIVYTPEVDLLAELQARGIDV